MMGPVQAAFKGGAVLGVGAAGYLAGSIGWAMASGVIGALLDSVGVVIPASTYLAASPGAGLIVAGLAVSKVVGS
jgi:hypothetical protein